MNILNRPMLASASRRFATSVLCLAIVTILAGCASPPHPQPLPTPTTTHARIPLACGLVFKPELCDAVDNTFFDSAAKWNEFKQELESYMSASMVNVIGGRFSKCVSLNSVDRSSQVQFFMIPRVLKSHQSAEGVTTFAQSHYYLDFGMTFLDRNGVLLFDVFATGHAQNRNGSSFTQLARTIERVYTAIDNGILTLSTNLEQNDNFHFFARNADFFALDDDARSAAIPQLLSESQQGGKSGPMLLAYAIRGNYTKLFDGLLAQGVSLQSPESGAAIPPMHLAALNNRSVFIDKLVAAGASVNSRDNENHLPLFYAAWNDKPEATHRLLDLNSEVDIFQPDLPVTSIQKIAAFGDYYASQWNKERAKHCYEVALKAASANASELKSASAKARSKRHWQTFAVFALGAVQGAAQQMAYDVQAKAQARDFAQVAALKQANASGTGFAGYYTALYSANVQMNNLARDQSRIAAMQVQAQTLRFENQAMQDSDLKVKEKALLQMSRQAGEEAELLRRKLAVLESAADYEQFKQTIGNTK